MKKNIILIGMPGSGKSTIGVLSAKATGMNFIDTDLVIQNMTGRLLSEIINTDGLSHFLEDEEKAVLSCYTAENTIIATGGSVILSEKAMASLKENGICIFIDVTPAELVRRISNISTRGIVMEKGETIDDIFQKRYPLYKKYADFTVTVSKNDQIEKAVEKIIKII